MKLLLDTHFVRWLAVDPGEINRRERALMSRNDLLVSPVSIWEMRIKWQKFSRSRHRRDDLLDPEVALRHIAGNDLELVTLTGEDCAVSLDPPTAHGDPFDEMLLVHAQRLGVKLLTRDNLLIDHPLAILA